MFRYKITPEEYMDMIRWAMREKRSSWKGKLKFAFQTVIQLVFVVLLLLFVPDVPSWMKIVLPLISLALAGLAIFQTFFLDTRARIVLEQRNRKDPRGTFWMEHKISLHENILRVTYGDSKGEIDVRHITDVVRDGDLAYIRMSGNVFEILPKSVTSDPAWPKFEKDLLHRKYEIAEVEVKEARDKVMAAAAYRETVNIPEDELVDTLVRMKRLSYATLSGWSAKELFTLTFPLLVLVFATGLGDPLYLGLAILAFLLFNLNFFLTFTPYYRKMVKSRLMAPMENGYLFAVTGRYVYLFGLYQSYRYDLSDLRKMVDSKDKIFLYFSRQRMVFASSVRKNALVAALQRRGGISNKAKLGSKE